MFNDAPHFEPAGSFNAQTETKQTVLNLKPNVDLKKQTMFFGESLGISRFDSIKYPIFSKLTEEQKQNFWNPQDINLSQDSIDFNSPTMLDNVKFVTIENLKYQSLLDSVQSRATILAFLPWVSLPEVEECILTWAFFESIHTKSYQWIIQNLYPNPSIPFDNILNNQEIINRATAIVRYYDDFINYSNQVQVFGYTNGLTLFEHKRKAYVAMASIYALESIRFYVSFSSTFAIANQEIMVGNGAELKLVARDEALHVGISLNILRIWPKEDTDFKQIAAEEAVTVLAIFTEVVDQEKAFSRYLYTKGAMLGKNAHLDSDYLESIANKRLKALGLPQIFANKTNPYPWMNKWIASDEDQRAPQEQEILDYKVNALNNSVNDDELLDF